VVTAAATAAWGLFTDEGRKFFADLGPHISEAWDGAVDWFKETFPGITEKFNKVAETIADIWQPIADFFKDKFGIVQKGMDAVKNVADAANTYVKEKTIK
jgi:phage-related protein